MRGVNVAGLLFLGLFVGCDLTIPIEVETDPTTIDGNPLCVDTELLDVLPDSLSEPVTDMFSSVLQVVFDTLVPEIESAVDSQNTGPVADISLTTLVVRQDSPPSDPGPSNSLGFLSSMVLTLGSVGDLPAVELGRVEDIPDNATRLDFVVNPELNLNPYIEAGLSVMVEPELKTCPQDDVVVTTLLAVEASF